MWVTQYRQHQFHAGLKIISYDLHLRAKFDNGEAFPPPFARTQAEHIRNILELPIS